jgi:hypothetical protein
MGKTKDLVRGLASTRMSVDKGHGCCRKWYVVAVDTPRRSQKYWWRNTPIRDQRGPMAAQLMEYHLLSCLPVDSMD